MNTSPDGSRCMRVAGAWLYVTCQNKLFCTDSSVFRVVRYTTPPMLSTSKPLGFAKKGARGFSDAEAAAAAAAPRAAVRYVSLRPPGSVPPPKSPAAAAAAVESGAAAAGWSKPLSW